MLKQKGQTLLEMIIIIGVVGVAMVAVTLASTISLRNSRISKERNIARNYVLEVFEEIKAEKLADPDAFLSQSAFVETLSEVGTNPVYARQVEYNPVIPGEKMEVTVTVSWEDSGRVISVVEQTNLEKYAQ